MKKGNCKRAIYIYIYLYNQMDRDVQPIWLLSITQRDMLENYLYQKGIF